MPWNTDDGGGNQGPWGQPPRNQNNRPGGNRGQGSGGGLPPELDDILQRGKESLKGAFPGGGGKSSWLIPLAVLAAFAVYNSVYQVQPDERGVVLQLGKYSRTVEPGLHFAIWPFETLETVSVSSLREFNVGNDGLVLTSDKNIVTVPYRVQWRARNAENFIFNVEEQERLVRVVTESAMREVVGQTPAQAVLASSNDSVAPLALKIAQDLLDSYQSGVTIETITTVAVQPPPEVADAFAEVVRADQNRKQSIAEAQQYKNQKLQIVEGEAAKLLESANAYKASSVADAQGETARFLAVYDQYKGAKDVTRQRIFLETLERVLSQSSKIIVEGDGKGGGVVPYLPLPEIQKRQPTAQAQ